MAKKQKLRQANETREGVAVLCFSCRRTADSTKQQGIASFFSRPAAEKPTAPPVASAMATPAGATRQCSKCLRLMEQPTADRSGGGPSASKSRVLPQIARIRSYQRVAEQQGVPFALSESAAAAMMREACVMCGAAAPTEGHGLTRLRVWPGGMTPLSAEEKVQRGLTRGAGFMGPFHVQARNARWQTLSRFQSVACDFTTNLHLAHTPAP